MFSIFREPARHVSRTVVPGETPEPGPKLNLGCGNDYRIGYINVDTNAAHRVDLFSDVTSLEAIADCSCSEAVAQDVLEHIHRTRATTALREWNRVLELGGRLTLRMPSLLHLLGLLNCPSRQTAGEQKLLIQCLYGTQGYEGDFHFNGFTEITLRQELADAGFNVTNLSVVEDWMFECDARKVNHVPPDPMLRITLDAEFIGKAYGALLGRSPDPEGLNYYMSVLRNGIAREAVLESLRNSGEHKLFVEKQC
jgi:hypothetical protein